MAQCMKLHQSSQYHRYSLLVIIFQVANRKPTIVPTELPHSSSLALHWSKLP